MNDVLCIIPARGGSKRVPRKNVRLLAGKPLLAYTIDAARASGAFADIVVSSDDEEILEVARRWGVTGDARPAVLAGDHVPMVRVAEEYLCRPGMAERYAHIAVMLPTCPFRTADDVRAAAARYHAHDGDAFLVTVTPYDFPPQLAMTIGDGGDLRMREPETYRRTTRSQSLDAACHPNGALYMGPVAAFLRTQTFFSEPLIGYAMPPERSMDIDYPYQFRMAEAMMEEQRSVAA